MLSLTVRQTAALVAAFVILSAGFITLDHQQKLDLVKRPLNALTQPVVRLFSLAEHRIVSIGAPSDSEVDAQLASVTAERDRLLAENSRLKQIEQEVTQLRQQLGFKTAHPDLKTTPVSVIGRDPESMQRFLVIDRGSNDGIQRGMAVVSPDFFVGQVTDVEPERARVVLSIDVSYQVGGVVQNDSNAEGVVYGRWQDGGRMQMRHLDPEAQVAEGDTVVTSDRTAMVPEGLVIGKVYHIERNVQADALTLEVVPMIDPTRLQSVMVILGDATK